MKKKGSMELGVNSIVILIIALAILGLGIGFVTRLFIQSEENIGGILGRDFLPIHATAENPIMFDKESVDIKSGKTAEIKVSVYNDRFASEAVTVQLQSCVNSDRIAVTVGDISLGGASQTIPLGTDGGYRTILKAKSNVQPDSYICTIEAVGNSQTISNQIIVRITR